MIDIENQVFTAVYNAVTTAYTTAYVTGIYESTPSQFPAVMVVQADNPVTSATQTSTDMEYSVEPMFEVDIFSNKLGGKKEEAKAIASLVDGVFSGLGFTRKMLQPIQNPADPSIFRIKARYTALVDKNEIIYRS